ncbi:histidinol dehydrogenase [Thermospira aquatica]|uniref:Histidinol dehydrogenase n=1 Tax=Thermospira aquatica TaxID=2828656 RepID=A0AAX3BGE2_9SPIR|nr:histidinol dehydrogenase [Thermospira aquatica]URA11094.1 histidinol dehydrogenase [Thermospira aquatica]
MQSMSFEEAIRYSRSAETLSPELWQSVSTILETVAKEKDKALLEYTRRFDGVDISHFSLVATPEEYENAQKEAQTHYQEVWEYFLEAMENITRYHEKQKEKSWFYEEDGAFLGQLITPIEKVGVYVPGGKAFYPSSVLMNVIPAKIAGVQEIYLTTPPGKDGTIHPMLLALAEKLGVRAVFKVGGAQAIAALAYGTETIPPVHKITGPGNAYVAMAKRLVQGKVGIDSIAGPSEVAIFADETAKATWIAMDLCAQAEHSPDSVVFFISTSESLINEVEALLPSTLEKLPRKDIIQKSLEQSYKVLVSNYEEGFAVINSLAPEHTEMMLSLDTSEILRYTKQSGALFLGHWTPVAMGDYFSGPNHVIPTYGTAVFSSPLGVHDFVKRTSVLRLSPEYMKKHAHKVKAMADLEGLRAHGHSASLRKP